DPTPSFWADLYKQHHGSGGPFLSGWLVRLLPYLKHREYRYRVEGDHSTGYFMPWQTNLRNFLLQSGTSGRSRRGLTHDQLPSSVSLVPFRWHFLGETLDYEFLAGVMTVAQDAETKAIRPRIGWAVRPAPAPAQAP